MLLKILLVVFVLQYSVIVTKAQFKAGSIWLGGSIRGSSSVQKIRITEVPPDKRKTVVIRPYLGRTINDNTILGVMLIYERLRENYRAYPITTRNNFTYGVGIFHRKYKMLAKGIYLFSNTEVSYASSNERSLIGNDQLNFRNISNSNSISIVAYPGISYAINNFMHLEMRVNYLINVSFLDEKRHIEFPADKKRDERARSFIASTAVNDIFNNVDIGFRFLFNNKKSK